ncbi:tRNA lysidine(34) synthetase TilS [uncultured Veillonella sp.]|uniref:tRNA lysidine(34) synthetase TilS n=1 Tax=uncultured Veillonella sp. TaxID=159268 RepID=UPI00261B0227|nr:tRNA lysidine(34) synthetase TilS [uncultured Veillonella sp.]
MDTITDFNRKVLQYELQHKTVPPHSSVLVACSGGPDSVGLLFWLAQFKNKTAHGNLRLGIAIIDHSLREESRSEVELVQQYGDELNIPVYVKVIDAQKEAHAAHKSVETVSRELRYEFFDYIMAKEGYDYLATAHHLDDQAETILAHLLRGSGTKGLTGMYPLLGHKWRPFLGVTKKEILQFVNALGLTVAFDKTNEETTYSRNRLRLEGIPYLRQYNPNITETLARLGEAVQADEDYLTSQALKALDDIVLQRPLESPSTKCGLKKRHKADEITGSTQCLWTLKRSELHDMPESLYYRIWRYIMEQLHLGGTFSMAQVKQLRQITGGDSPKQIRLGQVKVVAQYGIIQVGHFTSEKMSATYSIQSKRLVPWRGAEEAVPLAQGEEILIPSTMAPDGPILRRRREGDRIALRHKDGRIWGHKKLKDWLIDRKIPKEQRDHMWFCCSERIVFDSLDNVKTKPLIVWDEEATTYWACSIKEELL